MEKDISIHSDSSLDTSESSIDEEDPKVPVTEPDPSIIDFEFKKIGGTLFATAFTLLMVGN